MIDDGAQRRWWAVAGIDALEIATGQEGSAVIVAGALGPFAYLVRITRVPVGTVTSCLVISVGGAQRIDTALCDQTGVDTLVVDTGLNQRAFVIVTTADWKREAHKIIYLITHIFVDNI